MQFVSVASEAKIKKSCRCRVYHKFEIPCTSALKIVMKFGLQQSTEQADSNSIHLLKLVHVILFRVAIKNVASINFNHFNTVGLCFPPTVTTPQSRKLRSSRLQLHRPQSIIPNIRVTRLTFLTNPISKMRRKKKVSRTKLCVKNISINYSRYFESFKCFFFFDFLT